MPAASTKDPLSTAATTAPDVSLLGFHREEWAPGETAAFEYHCYESHASSDAELWYRSQQQVLVLGLSETAEQELLEGYLSRSEAGMPLVYRVRFSDGHEGDVWEDELFTSPVGYSRPPPPAGFSMVGSK
jgi:hypothetical protein